MFNQFLDKAAEAEGCYGASRLVCKAEWDYKLILKFDDLDSLKAFMEQHHERLMDEFLPLMEENIVGKVHEQNFVYDDIE